MYRFLFYLCIYCYVFIELSSMCLNVNFGVYFFIDDVVFVFFLVFSFYGFGGGYYMFFYIFRGIS